MHSTKRILSKTTKRGQPEVSFTFIYALYIAKKQREKRSWDKMEAAVYEIVLVRPKSRNLKLKEIYQKVMEKIQDHETRKRYIRKHVFSDVICELKKIRKVENLEERCDFNCFISVTDVGTVTAFRGRIIL